MLSQLPDWLPRIFRKNQNAGVTSGNSNLISKAFVTVALSMGIILSGLAAYQLRIQQKVIEDGNRKQIGLWLAEQAKSQLDTVFLEPLGYIGFYSQLKMLDFPGLAAPEVVAARKKLGSDRAAGLIQELKPDWLVLRAAEAQRISTSAPELLTQVYQEAKIFDVSDVVSSYGWLPGRDYLEADQSYIVFRRRSN